MYLQTLFALIGIAVGVVAKPTNFPQLKVRNDTGSPCAVVSSSAAAARIRGVVTPTVEAQLAYDCLNSVPLHTEEAIALVESILPYIEWQSGKHIAHFPITSITIS
jgi:hypothetical protein